MNDKRRKGTRARNQRQTQTDASGGKSQSTGGKVSEKFQATCTSKNPFEASTSQTTR
jgi:hypothetical protein